MSTQENVASKGGGKPLYTALLALIMVLLLKHSNWIWSSLYLQVHTATEISLALGQLAGFGIVCVATLRYGLGQATTIKLINVAIAMWLTYLGLLYLKQFGLIPPQSIALHKVFAVASAIAAGFLTLIISVDTWNRLHLAGIVGGLIFIFFPLAFANMNANTVYWPSPSYQPPTIAAPAIPRQNTIFLLLDEFSANAAEPVVEQLEAAGLQITAINIDSAGKNTINAIPAILMRTSFDQVGACGPTQLCSATKVLDFAKTRASSENIDVVGFYHRYCSIQGLRTCSFASLPIRSAGIDLACSFPGVDKLGFFGCDASQAERMHLVAMRVGMLQALVNAPFWQKGGILFAHLLVPHPLTAIPSSSLSKEYADGIANSASVVKLIATKAKLVFGANFRIIIFSDHPLRPEVWCSDKKYRCDLLPAQISNQVPLIIATSYADKQFPLNIKNTQTVFDLLFDRP